MPWISDRFSTAASERLGGKGRSDLPPKAGAAVYVRGESGRIATARVYDDLDPPLSPPPPA